MQMPHMDGLEVAELIKTDPVIGKVQIVMLTSIGYRGDGQLAKAKGVSAYLIKPTRRADLHFTLLTVLSDSSEDKPREPVTRHTIAEARKQMSIHVLVVDDNITNLEVVSSMLLKFGCRVDHALNGREAIREITEKDYDLVFMDCQMPVMDGYEATEVIRRMERESYLPIIAITANALTGDREKCLAAGMDDYLSKPFRQAEVLTMLETWSGKKHHKVLSESSSTDPKQDVSKYEELPGESVDTAVDTGGVLDLSVLDAFRALQVEGAPDVLTRLVGVYLSSSDGLITELREGAEEKDFEKIQNSAHSLKSSSANVGAIQLSEFSKELEFGCRNKTLLDAAELVEKIETEFASVKDVLLNIVDP